MSEVYFSKGTTSQANDKHKASHADQIKWPPEGRNTVGLCEASLSIGNTQQCVGSLTLSTFWSKDKAKE